MYVETTFCLSPLGLFSLCPRITESLNCSLAHQHWREHHIFHLSCYTWPCEQFWICVFDFWIISYSLLTLLSASWSWGWLAIHLELWGSGSILAMVSWKMGSEHVPPIWPQNHHAFPKLPEFYAKKEMKIHHVYASGT